MPLELASTSRADIGKAVFIWMQLLGDERYTEAYELTVHDPYYGWTPALLESIINGYGLPYRPFDEIFKVTSPYAATTESDNQVVYKDVVFFSEPFADSSNMPEFKRIGHLCYSIPLNGRWSDLSVTFTLLQRLSTLIIELNEIRVL